MHIRICSGTFDHADWDHIEAMIEVNVRALCCLAGGHHDAGRALRAANRDDSG